LQIDLFQRVLNIRISSVYHTITELFLKWKSDLLISQLHEWVRAVPVSAPELHYVAITAITVVEIRGVTLNAIRRIKNSSIDNFTVVVCIYIRSP
jgi:hypothetical protein